MSDRQSVQGTLRATLLPQLAIGAAIGVTTTTPVIGLAGMKSLVLQALFNYGAGGTTVDAYVQTSLDGGTTWIDIANFHFTTAAATKVQGVIAATTLLTATAVTDGSLTANTAVSGLLGDRVRVKYTSTGTYTGATNLKVDMVAKG